MNQCHVSKVGSTACYKHWDPRQSAHTKDISSGTNVIPTPTLWLPMVVSGTQSSQAFLISIENNVVILIPRTPGSRRLNRMQYILLASYRPYYHELNPTSIEEEKEYKEKKLC